MSLHSTKVEGSNPLGTSVGAICMLCSCLHVGEVVTPGVDAMVVSPIVRWPLDELCNHLSAAGIGTSVKISTDI